MNNELLLSIVIVTWNTKNETVKCLKSLYNSSDLNNLKQRFEIILVDNNSSDGTSEFVNANFPEIIILINDNNSGYAPACNQGMKMANGKYILLLGSDTEIKNGALIDCINYLENHNECAAAGGKLLFPDGRLQGNCKKFPTLKNAFFTYLSLHNFNSDYDMKEFKYDKTIKVDQIATTFLMSRRNVLEKVNYFDEDYKILYNDVDLCKRIWNSGSSIVFVHTSETFHHGNFSTKKAGLKIRYQMYKDIYRYYRRNFGLASIALIPILGLRFLMILIFK